MTRLPARRDVLRATGSALGAVALPRFAVGRSRAQDELRIAVVGVRQRGWNHYEAFRALPGVRVVALCDVDAEVLAARKAQCAAAGVEVATYEDIRELLARDDVDAVSLATPNHLHALHTIWACEAGKDVYVEKPVSHNLFEGRRMVDVARRTGRIVQSGMQSRSSPAVHDAIAWLRAGGLGAPTHAQGLCYKPRKSIGKVAAPKPPPAHVDHDLWSGPREPGPVAREQYHYDWHWQWEFGNGDLGNQGVHQVDLCRLALGAKRLPTRVMSFGGRFGYEDDGTTPNTMVVYYELEPAPMVFEVRGLPRNRAAQAGADWGKQMDSVSGSSIAAIVHAAEGRLVFPNYESAIAYDHTGIELRRWEAATDHFANFVEAVRRRDPGHLNADVVEGHVSAGYCHVGNDSYRLGAAEAGDSIARALAADPVAAEAVERMTKHLVANGVDVSRVPLVFGRTLAIDPEEERYLGDPAAETLRRGTYRAGFEIPEGG